METFLTKRKKNLILYIEYFIYSSMYKEIILLKIGGSILTRKDKKNASLRRELLTEIANNIQIFAKKNPNISLCIVHGAGAVGHRIAKEYHLVDGVGTDPNKWIGAFLTRLKNQKLNTKVFEIFLNAGLRIIPVHTASTIIQKDKKIQVVFWKALEETLRNNCIPLLYGELVFDEELGMSICSGDASIFSIAQHCKAKKVLFASDIDGIFDKDPHLHKNTTLIRETALSALFRDKHISLEKSHSVDVTGGLGNKITSLKKNKPSCLETVQIFNGLEAKNFLSALSGKGIGTIIDCKK